MKNGVCPKCGSRDIYRCNIPTVSGNRAAWDYEIVRGFKVAYSTRYVCLNCGFTERYFEDKELEKIRDKAKRG